MTYHSTRRRGARRSFRGVSLVAGGAGFVGSHLCDELLAAGGEVLCLDNFSTGREENVAPLYNNPRFRLMRHDIRQKFDCPPSVDFVYNLACPASPVHYQADPVYTMMTSVQGTSNLLELAEHHGARFLQASTSEVYGNPLEHPQKEDYLGNVNCTGPRACYDEGKRAAESLCFDMLRANRVDARVVRIFNTYGPRMRPDDGRVVSNIVTQALDGRPLTISGDGSQTRSFCYVSDLVAGLIAMMEIDENPGKPVNLGNPGEFSINELVAIVQDLVGTSSPVEYKPLPVDDPKRRRPDISQARDWLGWEPQRPLREGLQATIDWFAKSARPAAVPPRRFRADAGDRLEIG